MKKILSLLLIVIFSTVSGCKNSNLTQDSQDISSFTKTKPVLSSNDISNTEGSFEIHYIDVGQADCTLVLCNGQTMLIDGGNVEDSNLVAAYLKKINIEYLNYIICSHAHEDHVGGLSGALSVTKAGYVYAPVTELNTKAYKNFKEKVKKQNLQIINPTHGSEILLGSSLVQFLGPISENTDNINNTSIVLKITYGNTSFLFMGDAEYEEEQDIIKAGYNLNATVLKTGHHGSNSSTSYRFLRDVMPQYAIISVGKENIYGHPDEEVLSRFNDSGTTIYRTDFHGDIIVTSNGYNINVMPEHNKKNVSTTQIENINKIYIGNKKTKKFHNSHCHSLPKEKNRIYFNYRTEALENGYSSCNNCNP